MQKRLVSIIDGFFLLRIPLLAPVWTIVILGYISGCPNCSIGGTVFGSPLAPSFSLWYILVSFSFLVAAIYVVNQIADIESDRTNDKLFILPRGLISVRTAWILAGLCAAFGLTGALFYDGVMFALFAVSLIIGFLYDLPPANLKNKTVGGTVANFLGHGMLAFLVGFYAAAQGNPANFSWLNVFHGNWNIVAAGIIPSLSSGFANAAVYITTTIPDAPGDKATGKETFCVRFGEKRTALWALIFCVLAFVCAIAIQHNRWVMLLQTLVSCCFFFALLRNPCRRNSFIAFKWPVFLLTLLVSLFEPLYAVLILATFFGSKAYYKSRFGIDYPTFKAQ